jgi:hypothetical protein
VQCLIRQSALVDRAVGHSVAQEVVGRRGHSVALRHVGVRQCHVALHQVERCVAQNPLQSEDCRRR